MGHFGLGRGLAVSHKWRSSRASERYGMLKETGGVGVGAPRFFLVSNTPPKAQDQVTSAVNPVASRKQTKKLGAGAANKQTAKKASAKRVKAAPGAASTQDLYTGMSGQFAAMSEFLWRGYNVAIPAVDVGEDIFVVEAGQGVRRRVQVKAAGTGTVAAGTKTVQFNLSRSQLNLQPGGSDLFFMLLAKVGRRRSEDSLADRRHASARTART